MQKQPSSYEIIGQPYLLPPTFPVDWIGNHVQNDADITYLHYHNCLEIGYCHEGSGVFFVEDKILPYSKGDVSIIFPGQLHLAQSVKSQVSRWDFCFLDPNAMLGTAHPRSWNAPAPAGFANIISPGDAPDITLMTEYLMKELSQQLSGYESAVKGCLWTLMTLITRIIDQMAGDIPVVGAADRNSMNTISKSLEYISQHYMEPIHIHELAAVCSLSVTHFRRTFRVCMGMAPLDYLHNVRIQMASALLSHTDSSILSISQEVGYATISSFNRHFKHWTGIAPSTWRAIKKQGKQPMKP
ncbi:AraC family transcriptional regulator [Paenibacillus glucanolyticus]|uniref:AraC family transcriptional regulator n=1 Tax=Paenibacillus glucanolyticus TaxID=59843 RepID=UPI0030C9CEE7